MSGKLMGAVFQYVLTPSEQRVLLALADHATDEGESVRPSLALVAWKTGLSERQVQRVMRCLRTRGVLRVVRSATFHSPAEYRIVVTSLTRKSPFVTARAAGRGVAMETPLPREEGRRDGDASSQRQGRRGESARDVVSDARDVVAAASKPSLEPPVNRSVHFVNGRDDRAERIIATASEPWSTALIRLRSEMPARNFADWFKDTYLVGDRMLAVPNDYTARWLRERYARAIALALGVPVIDVVVSKEVANWFVGTFTYSIETGVASMCSTGWRQAGALG